MGMKPLPSLEDTFNMIKYEERGKVLVQFPSSTSSTLLSIETSAMVARGHQRGDHKGKKSLQCNHYNKKGHTQKTCWQFHGKPSHLKSNPKGDNKGEHKGDSKGFTTNPTYDHILNIEEIAMMRCILEKYSLDETSEKPIPSVTLAQASKTLLTTLL